LIRLLDLFIPCVVFGVGMTTADAVLELPLSLQALVQIVNERLSISRTGAHVLIGHSRVEVVRVEPVQKVANGTQSRLNVCTPMAGSGFANVSTANRRSL